MLKYVKGGLALSLQFIAVTKPFGAVSSPCRPCCTVLHDDGIHDRRGLATHSRLACLWRRLTDLL